MTSDDTYHREYQSGHGAPFSNGIYIAFLLILVVTAVASVYYLRGTKDIENKFASTGEFRVLQEAYRKLSLAPLVSTLFVFADEPATNTLNNAVKVNKLYTVPYKGAEAIIRSISRDANSTIGRRSDGKGIIAVQKNNLVYGSTSYWRYLDKWAGVEDLKDEATWSSAGNILLKTDHSDPRDSTNPGVEDTGETTPTTTTSTTEQDGHVFVHDTLDRIHDDNDIDAFKNGRLIVSLVAPDINYKTLVPLAPGADSSTLRSMVPGSYTSPVIVLNNYVRSVAFPDFPDSRYNDEAGHETGVIEPDPKSQVDVVDPKTGSVVRNNMGGATPSSPSVVPTLFDPDRVVKTNAPPHVNDAITIGVTAVRHTSDTATVNCISIGPIYTLIAEFNAIRLLMSVGIYDTPAAFGESLGKIINLFSDPQETTMTYTNIIDVHATVRLSAVESSKKDYVPRDYLNELEKYKHIRLANNIEFTCIHSTILKSVLARNKQTKLNLSSSTSRGGATASAKSGDYTHFDFKFVDSRIADKYQMVNRIGVMDMEMFIGLEHMEILNVQTTPVRNVTNAIYKAIRERSQDYRPTSQHRANLKRHGDGRYKKRRHTEAAIKADEMVKTPVVTEVTQDNKASTTEEMHQERNRDEKITTIANGTPHSLARSASLTGGDTYNDDDDGEDGDTDTDAHTNYESGGTTNISGAESIGPGSEEIRARKKRLNKKRKDERSCLAYPIGGDLKN